MHRPGHAGKGQGYRTTLITLHVGSQGVPDYNSFIVLANLLKISTKNVIKLFKGVTEVALTGSFSVWCTRNKIN